jgi:hypothetical protein
MNAVLKAPTTRRPAANDRRRSAVLPLAVAEGGRLVLHPIFVGGFLFSAALFTVTTWNHAPVLQHDDVVIALSVLPMAGATLLAANLATLRSRRHDTDELFDSEAATRTDRTRAHLLSVGWAVGAAILFELGATAFLVANASVGAPDVFELLTGPAVVAVAGALGVALARWWPSSFAGPPALLAVIGVQVLLLTRVRPPGPAVPEARWLALWVTPFTSGDPAAELLIRPTGWHLLYVLALTGVLAAAALARWRPRIPALVVGAACVALALVSAIVAIRPPSTAERTSLVNMVDHPERYQSCRTLMDVRYCAFTGYSAWIDRWAASISVVLDVVPERARPTDLVVRQDLGFLSGSDLPESALPGSYLTDPFSGLPLDPLRPPGIYPSVTWGRDGAEGQYQLGMALLASAWSVGLPRTPYDIHLTRDDIDRLLVLYDPAERVAVARQAEVGGPYSQCQTNGQARAVVALWLAAKATPGAERAFRSVLRAEPPEIVTYPNGGYTDYGPFQNGLTGVEQLVTGNQGTEYDLLTVLWTRAEANYALQLLDHPISRVTATVRRDWDVLTAPSTPSSRLVAAFGLKRFPTAQEQIAAAGLSRGPNEEPPFVGTIQCR